MILLILPHLLIFGCCDVQGLNWPQLFKLLYVATRAFFKEAGHTPEIFTDLFICTGWKSFQFSISEESTHYFASVESRNWYTVFLYISSGGSNSTEHSPPWCSVRLSCRVRLTNSRWETVGRVHVGSTKIIWHQLTSTELVITSLSNLLTCLVSFFCGIMDITLSSFFTEHKIRNIVRSGNLVALKFLMCY